MNFWIGYTPKYPKAFEVCKASLEQYGIKCYQVPSYYEPNVNTPFTRSRFLVPYLDKLVSDNRWVVYCDDDFLFLDDPQQLAKDLLIWKDIYCVKHPTYNSSVKRKSMGKQVNYPMKNWSSFMIMNKYSLEYDLDIFKHSLQDLHRFEWIPLKDICIGELLIIWNWLVGEYEENVDNLKALHYTLGGPWYGKKAHSSSYNKIWLDYAKSIIKK